MTPATLTSILAVTADRVAALRGRAEEIRAAARDTAPAPPWREAFDGGDVAVIAEIKRRSPSAGTIAAGLNPGAHAAAYEAGGAAAISVLTDGPHFGGSLDDLRTVRGATTVPVLRKDFLIDPLQIYESRAAGASAVLLIVRALENGQLRDLAGLAGELELGCLVEVHDVRELERALAIAPRVIGINSRDLETFAVDLASVEATLRAVPPGIVAVAESGIGTRDDVERVATWGADAILVGTVLASAADPSRAVRALAGVRRVPRGSARSGTRSSA